MPPNASCRAPRLLLWLFLALGALRMVLYLGYAAGTLPLPLEAFHLEAKMVLLAYRVEHRLSLYPDWWSYPHVANFFGPAYFVIVGLLGRLGHADIAGLFAIGRALSFGSTLLTTLIVALWSGRKWGRSAGVVAGVYGLGTGPMYGVSAMTRPDALAELLGLGGFLLTGARSRRGRLAGMALLILAILTKQTAGVYLLAALVATALEGEPRRALASLAGATLVLVVLVVAGTAWFEPLFARSLLGEAQMPWDRAAWRTLMLDLVRLSPEVLVLPLLGLGSWLGSRPRDVRPAV
ncbi:MAG TPA: hypothetical protein VIJ36_02125, partial [Thermoanaerobaculia bacterium]